MKQKLVFLDIDGTLIDDGETMHESTAKAIRLAKENGHKLFLCTGREKNIVTKKLFDAGFSDGVFSAGASVICSGREIFHSSFSPQAYDKIIETLLQHKAMIVIETFTDEIFLEKTFQKGHEANKEWLLSLGSIPYSYTPKSLENTDKIVFFSCDCPAEQLSQELGDCCNIVTMSYQDSYGGEIMQPGITKAFGIQKILDFYKMNISDTIGIGDGSNDIEMLQFCATGIAMGNASDKVKTAANMVTDRIECDGLYKAFEKIGLI